MSGDDRSWKIAVYESQRAHELELNKATSAFEHAVIAPLFLLNGGAAVAFLTLLGADSTLTVDQELTAWAIGTWAFGLFMAVCAVAFGYHAQRNFTKAVSLRRQLLERNLLSSNGDFRAVLKPLPSSKRTRRHKESSERLRDEETVLPRESTRSDVDDSKEHDPRPIQNKATRLQMVWLAFSTLSSVLFLVGVVFASRAVLD